MNIMDELFNKLVIVMFLSVIFIIGIASLIIPDITFSENENKVLAVMPEFSVDGLINSTYTTKVEEYFSDHIVLRNEFISLKNIVEIASGKKDNSRVYYGEDNILVEMHDKITDEVLNENLEILDEYILTLKRLHGIEMDLMIIPTKTYVYSESILKFANVNDEYKLIKEIYSKLDSNNIDVTDILKSNNDKYIYYDLDHHWTQLGAKLAYNVYSENKGHNTLNNEFVNVNDNFYGSLYSKAINPFFVPDTIDLYEIDDSVKYTVTYDRTIKTNSVYNMDNLNVKDKYTVFLDGNHAEVVIDTNVNNGQTLLVFKDSFGHNFIPFLLGEYERIIVLDLRYVNIDLKMYYDDNQVTDVLMLYNIYNFTNEGEFNKLKND